MKLEITPAQVIKMKSRLKGMGLLNKKDELVIGVFISAFENNNPDAVTREMIIEIVHLIEFTNRFSVDAVKYKIDKETPVFKYKNNKRISLD
jgi:hypothetical protein